jgi:hypothetical protein
MGSYLNFNKGLQIFAGEYDGISQDEELLFLVKEKISPMKDYGILESINLRQSTFFTSFRSFLGDIKVEVFTINKHQGLIKIDEAFLGFKGKRVWIDLVSADLDVIKIWVEQILEFKSIHSCDIFCTTISNEHLLTLNNLFSESGILFLESSDQQHYDSSIQIGTFKLDENDSSLTGAPQIYQDLSSRWILQSGWRYFRSFKNPRDWEKLTHSQVARDILGLPDTDSPRNGYADLEKWKNRTQIFSSEFLGDNS